MRKSPCVLGIFSDSKDRAGHCVAGIPDYSQFFASLFMVLVVLSSLGSPFLPLGFGFFGLKIGR
jgi:hypothetical protein